MTDDEALRADVTFTRAEAEMYHLPTVVPQLGTARAGWVARQIQLANALRYATDELGTPSLFATPTEGDPHALES